jgi:hypothetical protein
MFLVQKELLENFKFYRYMYGMESKYTFYYYYLLLLLLLLLFTVPFGAQGICETIRFTSVSQSYRESVGHLERGISPSQGPYLYRTNTE